MVIILVMIAGTAFIAGDLSKPDFDAKTYDTEIAKFAKNENQSLAVFNVIETGEPQYLIKELNNGIVLWKENKEIVSRLNSIENLPTELLEQNKKLLKYCDLRIQLNDIFVKAISEDTDKYAMEIDRIGMEIDRIIDSL